MAFDNYATNVCVYAVVLKGAPIKPKDEKMCVKCEKMLKIEENVSNRRKQVGYGRKCLK